MLRRGHLMTGLGYARSWRSNKNRTYYDESSWVYISKVTNSHNLLGLPIPLTYILVHLKKGPTWTNVEFLNTGVDHKVITTRQLKLSKDLSLMTHEQNNSSGKVD